MSAIEQFGFNGFEANSTLGSQVVSYIVTVTPPMAQEWLTKNNYINQRPIRNEHVAYLASEISRGHFVDGTPIHFAVLDGHAHLVNGQHTLAAIVQSDTPQRLTVTKTLVFTMRQVAELYFRHDNHLSRRISDAFRALGLAESTGLTFTEQQWVGSAIGLLRDGFLPKAKQTSRIPRDDLADGVVKMAPEARVYFDAIGGCRSFVKRVLTRRSTVAVALVTCKYSPDMARAFWSALAADDGLKSGDPRKTLLELMLSLGTQGGGVISRRSASTFYHCRAVATAWNAYYEQRTLRQIKVYDDTAPIKILGSPYHGDQNRQPESPV